MKAIKLVLVGALLGLGIQFSYAQLLEDQFRKWYVPVGHDLTDLPEKTMATCVPNNRVALALYDSDDVLWNDLVNDNLKDCQVSFDQEEETMVFRSANSDSDVTLSYFEGNPYDISNVEEAKDIVVTNLRRALKMGDCNY